MAKLVVDSDSLVSVADAIRTKGGTTEDLEFPQGFVDAVGAIESGGGTEEFTGFKLSGFVGYNQPTIADARSVPTGLSQKHYTDYWFANTNANANGGYWTRLEDVYLPSGLSALGNSAFIYCGSLKNIYGDLTSIKAIAGGAFSGCKSLQSLPYMPNLELLHAGAFTNCVGLTCVKIYKTLTQFNATAFKGCTNILDIYVPWAEGEVANAPWGATNATIHYNTTYDENHNPIVSEV